MTNPQPLYVFKECVAILGHWRYSFFSMIPVGATNVANNRVNFDVVCSVPHLCFFILHYTETPHTQL